MSAKHHPGLPPDNEGDGTPEETRGASRSQQKRDAKELTALARELGELSPGELEQLPLPDKLAQALAEYQSQKASNAKRRYLLYLGKIMRGLDPDPIRGALKALKEQHARDAQSFHGLEALRDDLLRDDKQVDRILARYPQAKPKELRSLVRRAREERGQGKPPHAFRALFRLLRTLVEGEPENE